MINLLYRARRPIAKSCRTISVATLSAVMASVLHCIPANAQGLRVSDGSPVELATLSSGEQLVLTNYMGEIEFGGRRMDLSGFSGVVGYASEAAYIVTISGAAESAGQRAEAGRMILIPPFGGALSVVRFDASRLHDAWDHEIRTSAPSVFAKLQKLAKRQSTGMFLGRLGRTNFNIAASGDAPNELARRSLVGGEAVQKIRFGESNDPIVIEQTIIAGFRDAMLAGDTKAAAEFLDPRPFGGSDLRGGAIAARELAAGMLLNERDWGAILNGELRRGDTGWEVGDAVITVIVTGDFAYVSGIRLAEGDGA